MPKLIAKMPLRSIAALKPGLHAVAPLLYLAIGPTGSRSWIFRYTVAGRKRDYGIGSYRDFDRDAAEREVARLRAMLRQGIDPIDARRSQRVGAAAYAPTFRQAMHDFHKAKSVAWSESHARGWLLEMEREVLGEIGNLRVDKIAVADVLRAIEKGWTERHETASRCRGRIESILDRSKVLGYRTGDNPARWKGNLDSLLPPPKSVKGEKRHHSAIGFEAMPGFIAKLRGLGTESAEALELLALTVARSGEISGMCWSEIDLDKATWTIPAARMKARVEHVVPLVPSAVAILNAHPRRTDDLVFDLGRDDLRNCLKQIDPSATVHGISGLAPL